MTSHVLGRVRVGRRSARAAVGGPRLVPLVFYTLLVIALFFAMIYLRIALDRTAFELDSLERQITLEESRQLDLRLDIARLQDPLRISTEAQRIGLTTPAERVAITIEGTFEQLPVPVPETPVRALPGRQP